MQDSSKSLFWECLHLGLPNTGKQLLSFYVNSSTDFVPSILSPNIYCTDSFIRIIVIVIGGGALFWSYEGNKDPRNDS